MQIELGSKKISILFASSIIENPILFKSKIIIP